MIFPSLTKNSLKKVKNVTDSASSDDLNQRVLNLLYLYLKTIHISFNLITHNIAVCLSELKIELGVYETSRITTIRVY